MKVSDIRKGMPPVKLPRDEFERRDRKRFLDPIFKPLQNELDAIIAAAWDAYTPGLALHNAAVLGLRTVVKF